MRVFLDTNIVLTGAFYSHGPAGKLDALKHSVKFFHSPHVLNECDFLIQNNAPSTEIRNIASKSVRFFLEKLGSQSVMDCLPPIDVSANDPDDDLILGSAIAANSDVICTYNIKDFPSNGPSIWTPLSIHRAVGESVLEHYIQPSLLSSRGTMLFFGSLNNKGSMGLIIESENGTKVLADDNGFIQLIGPNTTRHRTFKPLLGNEEFRLTLRYNLTDFEAAIWSKSSGTWEKDVLSTGSCSFAEKTSRVLFFARDHNFSGHVQCLSGLPRYVRDKQLVNALENYSLEAVAGSLDLKWFFQHCKVI